MAVTCLCTGMKAGDAGIDEISIDQFFRMQRPVLSSAGGSLSPKFDRSMYCVFGCSRATRVRNIELSVHT